ncbi:MAG: DNA translocase FtsK [Alphaproteobacteria bacterium]|nr:DNA translocase FtsK [Alphaproteobacteria bacterium]
MHNVSKQSKFLPDSVSGALKSLWVKICGFLAFVFGIFAIIALLFHNPYLDGFGTASSFGHNGLFGNVVGVIRYVIGFMPGIFLFLCVARFGFGLMLGRQSETGPEYNFLRGFVALCMGCAAFGLLVPNATYGGLLGSIVSADLTSVIGGAGAVLVGIGCLVGFCVLGGILLHVSLSDVIAVGRNIIRIFRWLLTAFHLIQPTAPEETPEEVEEESEEEEELEEVEETEEQPKAKRKTAKRKTIVKRSDDEQYEYELPDPKFLECSNFGKNVVTPELKKQASLLETHFAEYGVNGQVTGIRPGPIVTLYEFKPESGTRMVDVNKTVTDMTRAMATERIRIAHIPRTDLVGVEMVNLTRQVVRFRELVEDDAFVNSKYKIPLALGVNIGGAPMYFDLAKMPHMLVAGRTGTGKSVFVQSIITSIVYHFTPDKCKLMIIDPKGVDFGFWDDIPHLITPIVKIDPVPAVNALKWAVREMDDRYKQLQTFNAQNIGQYNEIVAAKRASGEVVTRQVAVGTNAETGELEYETQEVDLSDMPFIVIIIDEVADLMGIARKEVEACLQRIAQKARAAGIHLVMATQRPDATIITGVIKANFPTRISFQARSMVDSMTSLGEKGAENLLDKGDMLFSEAGRLPVRIHAALIDNDELQRIGDFLRSQGEPEYVEGVVDAEGDTSGGSISGGASASGEGGDLYAQAKEYVLRDKKPTISYIQRRLSIGYNKAAGFMERMEQEGIVSEPDANGKRHILQ